MKLRALENPVRSARVVGHKGTTLTLEAAWEGAGSGPATGNFVTITNDYGIVGTSIVMASALTASDRLIASYRV